MGHHEVTLRSRHHIDPVNQKPGGDVVWTCKDSDFRIWFPPENNPLEPGPDTSTNGTLTRKLKNKLNNDRYEYSMYLFKPQCLAEGNTPPVIIVIRS